MPATRKKQQKQNSTVSPTAVSVGLSDIEMKLLRLALDRGAYEGEADNAAVMFVRKLRERNANADELFGQAQTIIVQSSVSKYGNSGNQKMSFGMHNGKMIKDVPIDYLIWVIYNCNNIDPKLKLAIHNFLAETQ